MTSTFKIGDHVRWNSEAGYVTGRVIKVHKSDFEFMGRTRRASAEEPQYEVQSDRTEHVAAHKGSAMKHVR